MMMNFRLLVEFSMQFAIHVISGPSSQSSRSALAFCRACLDKGHQIKRVFFSGDGVYAGTQLAVLPQDEQDIYREWQALAQQNDVELVVCISASLRRGIINKDEADRYEKPAHTLPSNFVLSGLGQLIEASIEADRMLTFGG